MTVHNKDIDSVRGFAPTNESVGKNVFSVNGGKTQAITGGEGYQSFNPKKYDQLKEPMFFGEGVNVSRYDQQKYVFFEKLIEKQLSFFWRAEEVDLSRDQRDFESLPASEKHIFTSNLKYQIILDSVQGRSPNVAFLPNVSLPELETWIETWAFSETVHSRSYTHILRNVFSDPSVVFDDIVENEHIKARAKDVAKYYDDLINYTMLYKMLGEGTHVVNGEELKISLWDLKKKHYLAMVSVNVLEAIRFYVSFACSFAFFERNLMEGNGKIIKLIARDENLHMQGTQFIINTADAGCDDPDMAIIAKECSDEVDKIFDDAVVQEKEWAEYLFKDGSMIGLNANILGQYAEFIANVRLTSIGREPRYETKENPLPWMSGYLNSDSHQVAPQEAEISSYLVGQVDSSMEEDEFSDFDL